MPATIPEMGLWQMAAGLCRGQKRANALAPTHLVIVQRLATHLSTPLMGNICVGHPLNQHSILDRNDYLVEGADEQMEGIRRGTPSLGGRGGRHVGRIEDVDGLTVVMLRIDGDVIRFRTNFFFLITSFTNSTKICLL